MTPPKKPHTPITTVRIPAREKQQLDAMAKKAGVTLSDAFRIGARLYLEALLATTGRRGVNLGE
jgi:Ribbon-helix-helix protein, copG family